MTTTRRAAAVGFGLSLALVASACGSSTKSSAGATTAAAKPAAGATTAAAKPAAGATTAAAPVTTAAAGAGASAGAGCLPIAESAKQTLKAVKKIALVFDSVGRGDGSFNDGAGCGYDLAKKDFGLTGDNAVEQTPKADGSDRADKLSLVCKAGANPVIAVGFLFTDPMDQVATTCTTTSFGIIDSVAKSSNVAGLVFAQNEGSFLVGVAAGLKTKSNKVGFVGGMEGDLIREFQAGFQAGVKAANPTAVVTAKYAGTEVTAFSDPATGKTIGKAMVDEGIDVIYTAAGSTGNGTFDAVKEANDGGKKVWAIGVDSDQGAAGNKGVKDEVKPFIITSMLKRVDVAVYDTIKKVNEGTFKGGVVQYNLANGGIDYATTGGKIDDIKAKIDDFKKQIIAGTIKVPSKP